MKISFVGPGLLPIPPEGWGGIEHLVWDMSLSLDRLGHEVQIVNQLDPNKIIRELNQFAPDFVHIQYDDWVILYPHIKYPCAISTHFAYIQRPEMMGPYKERVFDQFEKIKPFIFGLSKEVNDIYRKYSEIPDDKLFLLPNGIDCSLYQFSSSPKFPDRSICLGKIDSRKRQSFLQQINSLWFAGNVDDGKFDISKNYLGELSKNQIFEELTDYGNLVLISDGEVHPRVCTEALCAGLGLVVSEWGTANLDLSKKYITVIPNEKISDIEYIEEKIIENREYSIQHREEIIEYSKTFDWENIYKEFYFPNIEKVISEFNKNKRPEFNFMDKNKAAYKLKNLSPIYYLNLDGQPERKEYMEEQFKYWEIENYTRISAYDGREDDLSDIIKGRYPDNMTSGEIGCTTSHLKALQHWIETSDSPYAVIMEDDVDLQLVKFWNFTWSDFVAKVPYDYDVIQLAIICTGDLHVKLHKRFVNDFSTAAYMITRHHAEKILRHHVRGDKYKLDNGVKPRAVADDLIYNSGNTFSIPLFLYKIALGSSIHPEHIDVFHRQSHDGLLHFWERQGFDMKIDELMNYDPYLGRITNPSPPQS